MFFSELKKEMERSLCWLVNCVLLAFDPSQRKRRRVFLPEFATHKGAEKFEPKMWEAGVLCFLYLIFISCKLL